MTGNLNPTITITISGPTGSGKSRILALINDVLKLSCSDCIIDAPQLHIETKMNGGDHTNWPRPRSGTVFKLEESNETKVQTAAPKPELREDLGAMTPEMIMDIFRGYGFKDPHGHSLEQCDDFLLLAKMATTPLYVTSETAIPGSIQITADHFIDRPVPVPIQQILARMGISIEHYAETDLQPLADLVSWALGTKPKSPEGRNTVISRGDLANQLIALIEPHRRAYEEEKIVDAAVLALFTTISPALVVRALRQIIGDNPGL